MKRRHYTKALFKSFLLLSILSMLCSCGDESVPLGFEIEDDIYRNKESTAVAVILGNHANAMAIPAEAYNIIETSLDYVVYGGYICAIVADGTPTKREYTDKENFFCEDAKNPSALNKRIADRKKTIIENMKTIEMTADSPEVDLLAAIREAKNALSSSRTNSMANKKIIVIDTGISTTGDLSFVDMDFIYGKPATEGVIERLKNYEEFGVLPDLSGITVTFCGTADGLAEVAAPQQASTTDKRFIRDFWEKVIIACGAEEVQFENIAGWDTPNIYTEDSCSKFPYVSVISFLHEPVIDFSELISTDLSNPDMPPDLPDPPTVEIKFPSETIGFQPDEAKYINTLNAQNILRPYADELKKLLEYFPDEKIWIVGTTAAVQQGATGSIQLSLQRAETVKSTLMDLGIPEKNLVTIGLGARFPWAVDEHPNGTFDTFVAQANRAVWLFTDSEDNDLFGELENAYNNCDLLPEAMSRFTSLKN